MDNRRRAAEAELAKRRSGLESRRADAERRSREADDRARTHGERARRIHDRMALDVVEERGGWRDRAADLLKMREEQTQAKTARKAREEARQELVDLQREERELRVEEARHPRRNWDTERREEAGQSHQRIAERHPDYAAGSNIGHLVDNPDDMHKVEAYARDYEQIQARERESVREQLQRGVQPDEATRAASDRTLREYGLYSHSHPTRDARENDEARRRDLAERHGLDLDEDRDGDDGPGQERDEGMGY